MRVYVDIDLGGVFNPCVVPYWSVRFSTMDCDNPKSVPSPDGAEMLFVGTRDLEAIVTN